MVVRILLLATAVTAMAGCSPGRKDNDAVPVGKTLPSNAMPGVSEPQDAAAADPAAYQPVSREFIVGAWGESSNCPKTYIFDADGSQRSTDAGAGYWRLEGTVVVMDKGDGTTPTRLEASQNGGRLVLVSPAGRRVWLHRCRAPGPPPAQVAVPTVAPPAPVAPSPMPAAAQAYRAPPRYSIYIRPLNAKHATYDTEAGCMIALERLQEQMRQDCSGDGLLSRASCLLTAECVRQ